MNTMEIQWISFYWVYMTILHHLPASHHQTVHFGSPGTPHTHWLPKQMWNKRNLIRIFFLLKRSYGWWKLEWSSHWETGCLGLSPIPSQFKSPSPEVAISPAGEYNGTLNDYCFGPHAQKLRNDCLCPIIHIFLHVNIYPSVCLWALQSSEGFTACEGTCCASNSASHFQRHLCETLGQPSKRVNRQHWGSHW